MFLKPIVSVVIKTDFFLDMICICHFGISFHWIPGLISLSFDTYLLLILTLTGLEYSFKKLLKNESMVGKYSFWALSFRFKIIFCQNIDSIASLFSSF